MPVFFFLHSACVISGLEHRLWERSPASRRADPQQSAVAQSADDFLSLVDEGNLVAVKSMIAAGTKPNVHNSEGTTPLMIAISNKDIRMAQFLIAAGADVNQKVDDINGTTILMSTANDTDLEMLKLLLNNGADPDGMNNYGSTALIWAAHGGQTEAARTLIEGGADINRKNFSRSQSLN